MSGIEPEAAYPYRRFLNSDTTSPVHYFKELFILSTHSSKKQHIVEGLFLSHI